MKRLRWQILVVVITLALVGVLLLSQGPVIAPIQPQAASGGAYTEGLIGAMGRLNPLLDWNNSADRDVNRLIYSGVMRFDSRGMPEPDLAESWGTTADGTIYNFSLRPNAVWHDGAPVTSDDVIFTIELIKSPASFYPQDVKEMWGKVEIIRLNDRALQFKIPEPYAPFLDYMTFGVLPKHLLESIPLDQLLNADFNLKPVGSGPYKFDHLLIDNGQIVGVTLVRNEAYYLSKPFIDQVVFKYYPTSADAMDAFRAGEVAGVSRISDDLLADALAEPNLSVHTTRLPQMGFVLFNLNNPEVPFLQETKIRRALMLGLNRQRLIDAFMQGQAIPIYGPILPGSWANYDGVEKIPYDADMAIALLKEAGYTLPADGGAVRAKEGKSLAFSLVHPNDEVHTKMAESIQQNWAAIGVQVTLIPVPYASLQNDYLSKRAYQAALVELSLPRTPDPDPYPFWHQAEATGGQNYSQWDNRSASEYLEQARVTTDFGLRTRLYRNFQVIFARELPALPLYAPVYSYGVSDNVLGVQVPPLYDTSDRFLLVTQWYLVIRRALEPTPTPLP
jgi:peptide/nickel transport system substrate-binding protein